METKKLKRGDWSECGTKRFYQYRKQYKNNERWLPAKGFDEYRINQSIKCELSRKAK